VYCQALSLASSGLGIEEAHELHEFFSHLSLEIQANRCQRYVAGCRKVPDEH
jgi:hypothetical protein